MCQKNKTLRNHGTSSKVSEIHFRIIFMDENFKLLFKFEYESYELAIARYRSYSILPFDSNIKYMILQKYRISKFKIVDMHIF